MSLKKLKDIFTSSDKFNQITSVDYFENTHAEGFTPNVNSTTQYKTPVNSLFGDTGPLNTNIYDKQNTYRTVVPEGSTGLYTENSSDLITNTNNPLIPNHWSDIGNIGTVGTQAVDLFGSSTSYYPPNEGTIPGFTRNMTPSDSQLISTEGDVTDYTITSQGLTQGSITFPGPVDFFGANTSYFDNDNFESDGDTIHTMYSNNQDG